MAITDHRIDDILTALDIIKKKLPNGELEIIKKSIESLASDQKIIKNDIDYFKKRMFDPDDGVIVKINKNTESIQRVETDFNISDSALPDMRYKISSIERWQSGVNKALWGILTVTMGLVITFIFGLVSKK